MGARTGRQVIERLSRRPREIYYMGERVADVTVHPAFKRGVQSLARLYDLQHEDLDVMTYVSPATGERVGLSFLAPRTRDDLARVRAMMKRWADYSGGMMGRSPDYLNRSVMAFANAAAFMAENDPRFGANIQFYYDAARENDLSLTHTLVNPQANRSLSASQQADPYLATRVVRETDTGFIVRGARMLATLPIADEILVFPSTLLKATEEDAPYAFAFAVPCDTPGLKFLCRESFDYGRSAFDHPLGSRFEEMDAVVIFDDVLVPWERVFLYRDVVLCNRVFAATNAVVHMAHQVITKNIAKTEFLLGIASLLVDTIAIESFQHIHEKIAEMVVYLEALRAFVRAAEVDAAVDRWGVMTPAWPPLDAARNMYPKLYPRMIEIIQLLGASGLMALPSEADLANPTLAPLIDHYFQAARANARDRIQLFRLAWDTALSAFGSRQVLYERYFFGDPVRMAGAMFNSHDRAPYMERVREFLERAEDEADLTPAQPTASHL